MRAVLVISAATMALAACQKSPPAASSAETAPLAAPAAAGMDGRPQRRPGLWQTSMSKDGSPLAMAAMKMCVDAAMDAKTSLLSHNGARGVGDSRCSYAAPARGADGSFSFTSTCPLSGGGQILTKGRASGDWSSAYHIHIDNVTTGASMAALNGHHIMDMDGKWLGPCPAGMAGGDMEFGNGMRISGGKLAGAAAMLRGAAGGGGPAGR